MSVAAGCLDFCRVETMLHVTCANYTKEESLHHLEQCKAIGIRNILALRGDHPADELHLRTHQFRALDMIRWIKEEYGDYFTLACSGYPTGHPEAPSYKADLQYLKSKVDAGAHFIITQMFFEAEVFENFVRDCREIGITVPIIPGIMPIHSYESIRRIAEVARLTIPNWILDELEAIKHDDEAVRKYGKQKAVDICRRLLKNGLAPSIHLYTLNREVSSREILEELGLWLQSPVRVWPWKSFEGNHALRHREDVRPIFWSIRPKAYVSRTRDWDDFPNGRWGNSSCPAFNDCSDYYLFYMKGRATKEEQLQMYGSNLDTLEAVQEVFINFITQKPNKDGYKVTRLPWNEYELGTQPETSLIFDKLIWCNSNGILTINSQPNVNGEPSTDPVVGWGKPGGYCYQKAYLEFFTSVRNAETIQKLLPACPRLSCHIINHDASIDWTNAESETPIAVTWGVFPGCEVAQPTVVDPISFRVWKDEAFGLWKSWANIYGDGSNGRQLLDKIHDEYCLITMVDNDYPKPSIIFDFLSEVLAANDQKL
ncbi:hypothetical protein AB6A40_000465 [Gnathostoma spinigerum]|uniref:MTHFR SAM-binding regulatory domain-containing protein n=1 Tax=Gnathostoma spinigerum TaxID=75299 RepID=A0ABD6E467_9BILA